MKPLLARLYAAVPPAVVRAVVRLAHPRFSVTVAGIFLAPDGRVLLLRHVYRHSYPWGLPSGFLAAGEAPDAGLLRELREETALEARVTRVVAARMVTRRHLEIVMIGGIDPAQAARVNHEIFEVRYCARDALPESMPPEQRRLILAADQPEV